MAKQRKPTGARLMLDHNTECVKIQNRNPQYDHFWMIGDGTRWLDWRGGNRSHRYRWQEFKCVLGRGCPALAIMRTDLIEGEMNRRLSC
jgi:hypothetical protein